MGCCFVQLHVATPRCVEGPNRCKRNCNWHGIVTWQGPRLPGRELDQEIKKQIRHEKTGVGGRIAKMPFPKLRSLKTRDAYFAPHEFEEGLNFLLKVVWLRENELYCIQLEISWVCYQNFQLHLRERRFNEVFSVPSVAVVT